MSFGRILVGVDGSEEGREALRQAVRLLTAGGWLTAVVVSNPALAEPTGWDAERLIEWQRAEAEQAVEDAAALLAGVPGGEARIDEGPPAQTLLAAAHDAAADLLAVGTHGVSRVAGIVLGSVATEAVHGAPCPVLVARGRASENDRSSAASSPASTARRSPSRRARSRRRWGRRSVRRTA